MNSTKSDIEDQPLLMNYQTRSLVLDLDPAAVAATLSLKELTSLKLKQILDIFFHENMSDHELLLRARARIDKCLFVGLAKRFNESQVRIAQLLGWQDIPENTLWNASDERLTLSNINSEAKDLLINQTYMTRNCMCVRSCDLIDTNAGWFIYN